MAPVKDGRFCGSCTQRVIDFTQLTDAEIWEAIRNAGGNCCGRFASGQLDCPPGVHSVQRKSSGMRVTTADTFTAMQLSRSQRAPLKRSVDTPGTFIQPDRPPGAHSAQRGPYRMPVFTAAAFTSFLLVQALPQVHAQQLHAGNATVCQAQDTAAPVNAPQPEGPYLLGKVAPYRILAGVVVNEQGKPLRGIAINVEGQRAPGTSDESGHFYVQLPLSVTMDQPLHLRLSDHHHQVQQATVTLRRAGDNLRLCFRSEKNH